MLPYARSLCALTLAFSAPLVAQTTGVVRGTVLDDKDARPLTNALIIVRLTSDTSRVTRAQTTSTGAFTVRGLAPGQYTLRASAIGYAPSVQAVSITLAASTADVGSIRLARLAVNLKGVDVKEAAAAVVIEPDRNSYKAQDVAPAATNASEVLEHTPSVNVDADGKVSLRGNESVVVQVNGRATPMTGIQLGAYLKTLPAAAIDRVEVMPNPSAKYDPDGTAGIINVVLKSNVDLGLSGGATVNAHSPERYASAGNLGYQRGALSTSVSVSANNDIRDTPGFNDLAQGNGAFSNQTIAERTGNGGQTVNTVVEYKLNTRDVLSNALTMNHRIGMDETDVAYLVRDASSSAASRFDRLSRSEVDGVLFDEDLAFKRVFVPRKHELNTEVRFTRTRESDSTSLWRQSPASAQIDRERFDQVSIAKQASAQLDYLRMLGARTKLETGFKSTIRWLDRDYTVFQDSLGTNDWKLSARSNALSFSERVYAVYGLVSQGVGRVEMQAGLRAEQADRDFSLVQSAQTYPYRYANIYPSAVARYRVNDGAELKASYSRRIRRPSSNELNPFITYYDLQNVFVGNPQLSPELTDAVELGATHSGSFGTVQVSPFVRRTKNLIRTLIRTGQRVEGRDVTTFSYANIATSRTWGADMSATLPSGRRFGGFASLNVLKTTVDGIPEASLSPTGFTWTGRLNATAQISPTLLTNVAYIYRAAIPVPNGHFYRAQNTNITVRKKLSDRSNVGISVIDPLGTNTFHIALTGGAVDQETQRTLGLRAVFVRYQYSFGRPPRMRDVQTETEPTGRPG